ncbi:hypothetical protein YDYSY3_57660 [Paenibacillus chitinolyticus]|uniref:hypothetical protein n=1 Tax=Paenibacillus chitinolyticus TaxID=79263 RepID=UPI0026E4CA53|nr:hypothetical protein [Paenibacillus chitinolyticus]GKS14766.1 hypothetical protein YDYSY3_57660 [Paenibacillus chitinolyticus]
MSSLKKKIDWMFAGNFLIDKDNDQFAYGINLRTYEFYSTYRYAIRAKRKQYIIRDPNLPLDDIALNMVIYDDTK